MSRYLFGADIFISYSHKDAINYAAGLAYELSRLDFSCVLDQWVGSGRDLPQELSRSLKRSAVLIVIATEGSADSEHVANEIEQFIRTNRLIVPISVGRALEKAKWSHLVAGLPTSTESEEAFSLASPSPSVIQRIDKSFKYLKGKRRIRSLAVYTAALVTLVNGLFLLSRYIPRWYHPIPTPTPTPTVGPTSSPGPTLLASIAHFLRSVPLKVWVAAGIALAILLLIRVAKDQIGLSEYLVHSFYLRILKRSPKRSLRSYQLRLLDRSHKLKAALRQGAPFGLRNVYVPLRLLDRTADNARDAFRAVLEFRHLVILGPPGSGKTTLLNFITTTFGEGRFEELPDKPIPVLLTINELSNSSASLKRFVTKNLISNGFPEREGLVSRYLEQGRFMLLFDGLDEVSNAERNKVVNEIHDFIKTYRDCRFVITSRSAAYKGEFNDLSDKTLTVAEFDDQQVRQFVDSYIVDPPQGKSAEQLMRALRQNQRVRSLARNPLMLALLSYLYTVTEFSPGHSMADFYTQSTEVLIRGWTREASAFKPAVKRRVLEEIALFAQDALNERNTRRPHIGSADVVRRTERVLAEMNISRTNAPKVLDEIVGRTGLLIPTNNRAEYQFAHLSFQEFFAAARLRDDPQGLIKRFNSDPVLWRESLRLWCGLAADSTNLIETLYKGSPLTALECLSDARRVDRTLANTIIDDMKGKLADFPQEEDLERAFGAIASSPHSYGRSVFTFLEETLATTEDQRVRLAAARTLSFASSKRSVQILANYYNDLPQIRETIVGMGDIAVPVLTTLARDGSLEALEDLRAIGTPAALETFRALVPLIGQRIESLKRKSSIKVEFDSPAGFYINRSTQLRLKITNLAKESLKDVTIELDDTAIYSVDLIKNGRAKTIPELKEGDTQVVEYPITITRAGLITLQLKVDGEIYKEQALEINAVKDNPYFYGPPVKNTHNFFGRENELQTSLNNIMSPSGAHTMIIGEQRSGKTSLLYQIRERLSDPYVPVFISFSGVERAEMDALSWLLHRIGDELTKSKAIEGTAYIESLTYASDFGKRLESIIREIKSVHRDWKLILLLDEAHLMNEIGEKFQEILRESFLQLVEDLRVVLACYYDFFDDLKVSGSPLHNIFEFIFLKPFQGHDLRTLIVEPAAQFGYSYDENAIKGITTITGGHPYYCQYLCAKSFLEAEKEAIKVITTRHVQTATRLVLANDKQRFQLGYWNAMRPEERVFLKLLIAGKPVEETSKQVINRLKNKFVIKELDGHYDFTAGLFKEWTKQLIQEDT